MAMISGVIERVSISDQPNRGGYFSHGYMVNGQYYNVSKKTTQADFQRGQTVEFEFGKNANGYPEVKGMRVVGATQASAPTQKAAYTPKQAPVTDYDAKRQSSIVRQNSLAHATAVVVATTKSKSPDEVAKEVIRIADFYFLQYSLNGVLPTAEEEMEEALPDEVEPGHDNW